MRLFRMHALIYGHNTFLQSLRQGGGGAAFLLFITMRQRLKSLYRKVSPCIQRTRIGTLSSPVR